jgi:hypothetical protein
MVKNNNNNRENPQPETNSLPSSLLGNIQIPIKVLNHEVAELIADECQLMTIKETMAIMRVSRSKVGDLIKDGDLEAVNESGARTKGKRVTLKSIKNHVENCKIKENSNIESKSCNKKCGQPQWEGASAPPYPLGYLKVPKRVVHRVIAEWIFESQLMTFDETLEILKVSRTKLTKLLEKSRSHLVVVNETGARTKGKRVTLKSIKNHVENCKIPKDKYDE